MTTPTPVELSSRQLDLLARPVTGVLTTVMADGGPQASPVWFLFEDGDVLVSCRSGRVKVRNIRREPRVAFVVFDPDLPARYVELRGTATVEADTTPALLDRVARKHGLPDASGFDPPGTERVVVRISPHHVAGD